MSGRVFEMQYQHNTGHEVRWPATPLPGDHIFLSYWPSRKKAFVNMLHVFCKRHALKAECAWDTEAQVCRVTFIDDVASLI